MKNTRSLKKLIISDIIALCVGTAMLCTLTFAWFFISETVPAEQSMDIGKLTVSLDDGVASGVTETVNVASAYPTTRGKAIERAETGGENKYVFTVKNTGSLPAMLRIFPVVVSDTGYSSVKPEVISLSRQIRYALRVYNAAGDLSGAQADGYGADGFLVGEEPNVSFKTAMRLIFLKKNESGSYVAADGRALLPGEVINFELIVWLDKDATVESTGANETVSPSLRFKIRLDAGQAEGGDFFTAAEAEDSPGDGVPEGAV